MNKAELASALAAKLNTSKKMGEDFIEAFTSTVTEELKKGTAVVLAGFGAFTAKQRAGRVGVNPQNPSEKIQIPAVTVAKFKTGKALKDALKGK
ncbi:MAG: HU family DNA-binding protein [Patescibacteria group bacterium]